MTPETLEAIRARDACWNDGKQWNGSIQYAIKINSVQLYGDGQSTMVGDRRALLDYVRELEASLDWAIKMDLNGAIIFSSNGALCSETPPHLAATLAASRKRITGSDKV